MLRFAFSEVTSRLTLLPAASSAPAREPGRLSAGQTQPLHTFSYALQHSTARNTRGQNKAPADLYDAAHICFQSKYNSALGHDASVPEMNGRISITPSKRLITAALEDIPSICLRLKHHGSIVYRPKINE